MPRTRFEDDDRDDDYPARSKGSGSGLLIGLLVAGGLLVVLVCGGGMAALFFARTAAREEARTAEVRRAEAMDAGPPEVGPEPREVVPNKAAPPPVLVVDAGELCWAFQADRAAAERRYQGKVVELSAAVARPPGRNPAAPPFVALTAGALYRLSASFREELGDRFAELKTGATVRVRGTLVRAVIDRADSTVTVTLDDCTLLDVRPAELGPGPDDRPPPKPADAKPPPPAPAEDRTPIRQAIYIRVVKAIDDVEAAALKKFGRAPRPDDKATFTGPYKLFVERETEKALDSLAADQGMPRSVLDGIRDEGDRKGWPKK